MAAREDPGHIPNHLLQFVSLPRRANSYDRPGFAYRVQRWSGHGGELEVPKGP